MTLEKQIFWLKVGAEIVMVFALVVLAAAHPATNGLTVWFADLLFWPLDGLQTGAADEARLLSAIGGGIMLGWGALLFLMAGEGMREAPVFTRKAILVSIWTWFVADSFGSVVAGAPLNAVGNVGFLLLFVIPLRKPAVAAVAA